MTTLKDVAMKAGVSTATASIVLNDRQSKIAISKQTKKRVLEAVDELDYVPNVFARSLRTKKTGIMGVIVSDIKDPYYAGIIEGIEKVLNENGYNFFLSTTENSLRKEELYLDRLHKVYAEGFLIVGGIQSPFAGGQENQLEKEQVPMVVIGRSASRSGVTSVSVDNFAGAFKAAEHLIELGHRDILHISAYHIRVSGNERMNGYKSAMQQHGFKNKCWIEKAEITAQSGYKVMTRVLKKGRIPTAVLAYNDVCALGVMRAIKEHGLKIPEDIAVVGFDDIPIAAYFDPPLTTVRQPQQELGMRGAALLMNRVKMSEKRVEAQNIILDAQLIVRESSGVFMASPINAEPDEEHHQIGKSAL